MEIKYSVISNYFSDSETLIEAAKHVNSRQMFCESKYEGETIHGTVYAFEHKYKVEVKICQFVFSFFKPTVLITNFGKKCFQIKLILRDTPSIGFAICECECKKCIHIAAVLLQQATTDPTICDNGPLSITCVKQDYDENDFEVEHKEFFELIQNEQSQVKAKEQKTFESRLVK